MYSQLKVYIQTLDHLNMDLIDKTYRLAILVYFTGCFYLNSHILPINIVIILAFSHIVGFTRSF